MMCKTYKIDQQRRQLRDVKGPEKDHQWFWVSFDE